MWLTTAALSGHLPSGTQLRGEARREFACVALGAMALAGDGFFDAHHVTQPAVDALAAMKGTWDARSAFLTLQCGEDWPAWTVHLLAALHRLERVASTLPANGATEVRSVARYMLHLATMNLEAFHDTLPIAPLSAAVSADLPHWLTSYLEFGTLHHTIIADAMALRERQAAGHPLDSQGADILVAKAYELIDDAEQASASARASTRLSDMLLVALVTLPFYAAAKRLLRWAVARKKEAKQPVPADWSMEAQVVEECRAACVETLTYAGTQMLSQAISAGFIGASGESVAACIRKAGTDVSARIPHCLNCIPAVWAELARDVPSTWTVPYSSALNERLLVWVKQAVIAGVRRTFTDAPVVEAVPWNQYVMFGHYEPRDPVAFGMALNPEESRQESEAALVSGERLLSDGRLNEAERAYRTALRLEVPAHLGSAYFGLGQVMVSGGDLAQAQSALRAALNDPKWSQAARERLSQIAPNE